MRSFCSDQAGPRRRFKCSLAVLLLGVVLLAAISFPVPVALGGDSAPARASGSDPDKWALVVTANLAEAFDSGDVSDHSELRSFISKLLRDAPRRPDVLLLQEVRRSSATWVAQQLSRATGGSYVVGNNLAATPWHVDGQGNWTETDTAIVFDKTRMRLLNSGFVSTKDPWSYRKGMKKRQAWALLQHRASGQKVGAFSLHFAKSPKNRQEYPAMFAGWTEKLAMFFHRNYPKATRMIGGDFNHTTASVPSVLAQFGYGRIAPVEKPFVVDYIFSTGIVGLSGRDADVPTYSNHRYLWATTYLGSDS